MGTNWNILTPTTKPSGYMKGQPCEGLDLIIGLIYLMCLPISSRKGMELSIFIWKCDLSAFYESEKGLVYNAPSP